MTHNQDAARNFRNYLEGDFSKFHLPRIERAWREGVQSARLDSAITDLFKDYVNQIKQFIETENSSKGFFATLAGAKINLAKAVAFQAMDWLNKDLTNWAEQINYGLADAIKSKRKIFADAEKNAQVDQVLNLATSITSLITGLEIEDVTSSKSSGNYNSRRATSLQRGGHELGECEIELGGRTYKRTLRATDPRGQSSEESGRFIIRTR